MGLTPEISEDSLRRVPFHYDSNFHDPYLATVRNLLDVMATQKALRRTLGFASTAIANYAVNQVGITRTCIPSTLMSTGNVRGLLRFQTQSDDHNDSPLAVVVPGTAQDVHHAATLRLAQSLRERGYHVLSLPNPFTGSYVSSGPVETKNGSTRKVLPGRLDHESENLAGVVAVTVRDLEKKGISVSGIHFVGTSYGAHLAAAAAARIKDVQSITLFSPMLDSQFSSKKLSALSQSDAYLKYMAMPFLS